MIDTLQHTDVVAMFFIGLFGAGHCAGMCGGLATALGLATRGQNSALLVFGYNIGRISSYALAGVMVATIGYWSSSYLLLGPWLRLLAGLMLILMGFYLANWWNILLVLEKIGAALWRRIQPMGNYFLPVTTPKRALVLGMVWGWLPCGLVYSALAYTATAPNPGVGALLMIAFGLGTAPAMLVGGFLSEQTRHYLQLRWLRRIMAILIILLGSWTIANGIGHIDATWLGSGSDHHGQ